VIINIDQRSDAVAAGAGFLECLLHPRARKVPDRLRSVLVAARSDKAVEVYHQVVVDSDRNALHGVGSFCRVPTHKAYSDDLANPACCMGTGRAHLVLGMGTIRSSSRGMSCGLCMSVRSPMHASVRANPSAMKSAPRVIPQRPQGERSHRYNYGMKVAAETGRVHLTRGAHTVNLLWRLNRPIESTQVLY
jgi:hypothetical protein